MHQNQSPILRQNVIKKPYIFAFTQKDGTEIEREIMAESMSAAKLCAKAIAEQENLKWKGARVHRKKTSGRLTSLDACPQLDVK